MTSHSDSTSWSFPGDLPGSWHFAEDHTNGEHGYSCTTRERKSQPAGPTLTAAQQERKRSKEQYGPRQCRICFDVVEPTFLDEEDSLPTKMAFGPRVTYESEEGGRLLSPCKCRGSQRYVHEDCLSSWRYADPSHKRNYFECPTCGHQYLLQRMAWGSVISSTVSQVGLTLAICLILVFLLGFIADPIINLYLDPLATISSVGLTTPSIVIEQEPGLWVEHFAKGFASLSLLGFAKFLIGLSPLQWLNVRGSSVIMGRSSMGGTGRDRLHQISWFTLGVGTITVLWVVWAAVRA